MKVLFATDGSAHAEHAIQEALRFLRLDAVDAYVIGVARPHRAEAALATVGGGVGLQPDLDRLGRDVAIARAQAQLATKGVDSAAITASGHPAEEILASARQLNPDLIVMGSQGLGALERLVLGSVSDAVAHGWPGAVLVVRPTP